MNDTSQVPAPIVDIVVIGGGINGVGIARDAAGRGLNVWLCEQNDFASGTSSASTKLIHGGLRYLEQSRFRLVRESLQERQRLFHIAPHLIKPMRFILPHAPHLRPAWMIQLGLFLYDHLGGRSVFLPSKRIQLTSPQHPLKAQWQTAFEYTDCWVDDARLVIANALDAQSRGATLIPRCEFISANAVNRVGQSEQLWQVTLRQYHPNNQVDATTGQTITLYSRALINAAGPWADQARQRCTQASSSAKLKLVKGSHIVVPAIHNLEQPDHAYIFQHHDGRIIFAIPFQNNFTLIGTTDENYTGDPAKVAISSDEIAYLCNAVSEYFEQPVQPEQVVWQYSGVRPLYDDGSSNASKITRDYVLALEQSDQHPPLLSVYGGKLTTYRRLAEQALAKLHVLFPHAQQRWTDTEKLPGSEFTQATLTDYTSALQHQYPWLPSSLCQRLAATYGTRAEVLLAGKNSLTALGKCFGADFYLAEAEYLYHFEWAQTAEDTLWRRTKLGLQLSDDQQKTLQGWFAEKLNKAKVQPPD